MSILRKVSSYDKLVLKNGFLTISAYYSRRSKEEFESYFKVITSKSNVRGLFNSICDVLHNNFSAYESIL